MSLAVAVCSWLDRRYGRRRKIYGSLELMNKNGELLYIHFGQSLATKERNFTYDFENTRHARNTGTSKIRDAREILAQSATTMACLWQESQNNKSGKRHGTPLPVMLESRMIREKHAIYLTVYGYVRFVDRREFRV